MSTITQRIPKQTKREESIAYEIATYRDLNSCQKCRRNCGPIARDHRKNRSQGGRTVASNLQCLGLGCHTWKSEHPEDAIAEGWAVPGWADPALWPARRYIRSGYGTLSAVWVLYDDLGRFDRITDQEAAALMTGVD